MSIYDIDNNNIFPSGMAICRAINSIHRTLTAGPNIEYYVPTGTEAQRSTGAAASLADFMRYIWQTLQIVDNKVVFCPSWPDYILETNKNQKVTPDSPKIPDKTITWMVVRKEVGTVDPHPFGNRKELRPRVREALVKDPLFVVGQDDPSTKLKMYEISGQWFDNLIQFDIWTKSNTEAEELVTWFEDFMDIYRGMFKELGVNQLFYDRRVRDELITSWRNGFLNRSVLYYVRTEKIWVNEIHPIKQININAELYTMLPKEACAFTNKEDEIIQKWIEMAKIPKTEVFQNVK